MSMRHSLRNYGLLLPILIGIVLHIIDTFIVNIAAPSITYNLGANGAELILITTAYSVSYACGLSISGQLGDQIGYHKVFLVGMVGFIISSTLCAIAVNSFMLIGFRVLQGCSAAMVVPQVLAMININFSGEQRIFVLSVYGMVNGVVAGIAQLLGGVILSMNHQEFAWRLIFLLNLPVGILGIILAVIFLPYLSNNGCERTLRAKQIDYSGAILLAISLATILFPSAFLSIDGITREWCLGAVISSLSVLGLIAHIMYRKRKDRSSIINLAIMRDWIYSRSLIGVFLLFFAYGGMMLLTTISLQTGLNFSPMKTGSIFCCYSLGFLLGSRLSHKLLVMLESKKFLCGGMLFTLGCSAMILCILQIDAEIGAGLVSYEIAGALLIIGWGQSTILVPLLGLGLHKIEPKFRGAATGMWSTTQQLAISISAICIGGLYYALARQDSPHEAMMFCFIMLAIVGLTSGIWMTRISYIVKVSMRS